MTQQISNARAEAITAITTALTKVAARDGGKNRAKLLTAMRKARGVTWAMAKRWQGNGGKGDTLRALTDGMVQTANLKSLADGEYDTVYALVTNAGKQPRKSAAPTLPAPELPLTFRGEAISTAELHEFFTALVPAGAAIVGRHDAETGEVLIRVGGNGHGMARHGIRADGVQQYAGKDGTKQFSTAYATAGDNNRAKGIAAKIAANGRLSQRDWDWLVEHRPDQARVIAMAQRPEGARALPPVKQQQPAQQPAQQQPAAPAKQQARARKAK